MVDFQNFYTIEQYKQFALNFAAHRACPDTDGPHVDAWLAGINEMETSLYSFLQAKATQGELDLVPFVKDRGLRWANSWNRMVQGEATPYDVELVSGMCLHMSSVHLPRPGGDAISIEESYKRLVRDINDGKDITPMSAYGNCFRTGETYFLKMKSGWEPIYGKRDKTHSFIPLDHEVQEREVQHDQIEIPSGELLICDWFRIKAFTTLTKLENAPSINTEFGCLSTSAAYAKKHGFMSVFVGDCGPDVIVRGDQLLFGRTRYDEDLGDNVQVSGENLGTTCSDLWWISAIDRQTLTNIVAKEHGVDQASKLIDEMISEYDVKSVQLQPGSTLHIYHVNKAGLQKDFSCDQVDSTDMEPLFAVASLKELPWTKANQNSSFSRINREESSHEGALTNGIKTDIETSQVNEESYERPRF